MEGNGKATPEFKANGQGLSDFWNWASQKGLMNQNTAASLRAACSEVLAVLDNWEQIDLRGLDSEDVIRRFQNLKASKYKPESLQAYARRFRTALSSYLSYLDNPAGWKPSTRERVVREKPTRSDQDKPGRAANGTPGERGKGQSPGLLDYFFPLRENLIVQLRLPADLKMSEVQRLQAFLASLTIDFRPPNAA